MRPARSLDARRVGRWLLLPALALAVVAAAVLEARTFRGQAWLFSSLASKLDSKLGAGPAPAIELQHPGPYDERLGYARLPRELERLHQDGWRVVAQARLAPLHERLVRFGMSPIYREKAQTGLEIIDAQGDRLYEVRYPGRVYQDFESVPPLVAQTLTFIENRELLDPVHLFRNPAVEWDRLATAVVGRGVALVRPGWKGHGGSTLATQLEKSRHSPGGRTPSGAEKLRQMATASLRAYRSGPITEGARRSTLVEYLNALPLAAQPGYGEVHGLGDGLWAWYGADFDAVNRALLSIDDRAIRPESAIAYRLVLSLLLAQRRPAYYLVDDPAALDRLTDRYLALLDEAGMLPTGLAAAPPIMRLTDAPPRDRSSLAARKADLAVRSRVAQLLGTSRLYDLDRYDLKVTTTLDAQAQRDVTGALLRLADRNGAVEAGVAPLLGGGDPAGVLYSFTLYERSAMANAVRVQVDSGDRPLDLNDGAKLELGSTAKLRTLVTYLELIAQLHDRYAGADRAELEQMLALEPDRLTAFVVETLLASPDLSLDALLEAAMVRKYSASPWEGFFTGGGLHYFQNFDDDDNGRVLTVRAAFHRSVNLVFIRLMRDLVEHHRAGLPDAEAGVLDDPEHPLRESYLDRFADREGADFVRRFYREHRGENADQLLGSLVVGMRPIPKRIAAAYRSTRPDAPFEAFDGFLRARLPRGAVDEPTARLLYQQLSPERMSLSDRGYVARVHPLELWVIEYLSRHRDATLAEVLDASADARQEVYEWLHRSGHKTAQDRRIRTLLDTEAYAEIHRDWRRVGYPFDSLVPSFATAIGSSADRPSALAELLGILVNDGVRRPTERLARFHFGAGTPFETVLEREPVEGEQVLHREVAAVARQELLGVVRGGTAARARKAIELADGRTLDVGGKTGTGDNRVKRNGVPASRAGVMNRTASFVFTVGDRFYGTILVYVPGEAAADYSFTSSAAVQVWNHLLPSLQPLFERPQRASEWSLFGAERSWPSTRGPSRQIADAGPAAAAPGTTGLRVGGRLPAATAVALAAVPARQSTVMVDLDRSQPREDGEAAHGFRFPDPLWRRIRQGEECESVPPSPFTAAVLSSSSARMVPVVRRRGRRQPPALV
jgi:membrane peptidoglycan carboxypeptidase